MTGLRDYILLLVLGGLVPISFLRPWIGILGWFWIAYMVPHSLMWGFGRSIPLAALVGGATLLGFIFTKDRKPLPRSWTVLFVLLFIVHMTISTVLSFSPELAWHKWNWVSKILPVLEGISLGDYALIAKHGTVAAFPIAEPLDPAGFGGITSFFFAGDDRSYVYSYQRTLADLYLVSGLK